MLSNWVHKLYGVHGKAQMDVPGHTAGPVSLNTLSSTQPVHMWLEKSKQRISTSALPSSSFAAFNTVTGSITVICPLSTSQKTFTSSYIGLSPLHEEPRPPAGV